MQHIAKNEDKGKRLDCFLQEKFPQFSRAHLQNALANGNAFLERNGKKLVKAGEKIKQNDVIFFDEIQPKKLEVTAEKVDFEIIYQDGDLAVVNKPQGVVVHPCASCKSGTLVNGLVSEIQDLSGINGVLRPGIVHRIDKNTCGLLLIAKNDFAHVALAKQIALKQCQRTYLGLIDGFLKNPSGTVETYIGRDLKNRKKMAVFAEGQNPSAKLAITNYRTVEYFKTSSLVEFTLQTGRTHQIRVHAKHLNHPLVGDETYGGAKKFGLVGQFLCAYKISFVHPRTQEQMTFEISLPQNFEKILANLRKEKQR